MEGFLLSLQSHKTIIIVAFVIVFDLVLGCLRAVKEHRINSTIGIDGAVRKATMIVCLIFLVAFDYFVGLNIIGWLPESIISIFSSIGAKTIVISDVVALMFIVFELLSVIKNWTLIGLPMFKGVNDKLTDFLVTFTDETSQTNKN